jgi:hypothetical protein
MYWPHPANELYNGSMLARNLTTPEAGFELIEYDRNQRARMEPEKGAYLGHWEVIITRERLPDDDS